MLETEAGGVEEGAGAEVVDEGHAVAVRERGERAGSGTRRSPWSEVRAVDAQDEGGPTAARASS